MIFEQAGMFTTFQTTNASDGLALITANALVGNSVDTETVEMTFVPGVIRFDEPTLIALTGADFHAYTDEKNITPYKVHYMEQGDTLKFYGSHKGTRAYMAVAGGIQLTVSSESHIDGVAGLIKDGDRYELKRNYSAVQKKMLFNLMHKKEASWGVDAYSLARVYFSDVFHIVEAADSSHLTTADRQAMTEEVYEVSHQFGRSGFVLDGSPHLQPFAGQKRPLTRGTIQLNPEGQLVVLQNDMDVTGEYPQIAMIAPHHLPKLSQKKPGSKLILKWESAEEYEQSKLSYDNWIKSLLKQINYQLNHQ